MSDWLNMLHGEALGARFEVSGFCEIGEICGLPNLRSLRLLLFSSESNRKPQTRNCRPKASD
jgi:hypothetical protein